jgi:sugar/nucleoside kinase (ribokinase family)
MKPLLITGSIAIDTIRNKGRLATDQLGGSAAFAALAARHWCKPVILSAIGGDYPPALERRLLDAGLDLRNLTRVASDKSFRWEGVYKENLGIRETIGVDLGVMATASLLTPADIGKYKFAMMATYAPEKELEVAAKLPPECFIAVDTIAVYINTPALKSQLLNLIGKSGLLCIDDGETAALTGTRSEEEAVRKVFEMGPKWMIVKHGKLGSILYSQDGKTARLGIYDNIPIETTGAGDTFLGSVMAHLAATGKIDFATIMEGMRLGTAAASVTVEAFGVEELIKATRQEIERRAENIAPYGQNTIPVK